MAAVLLSCLLALGITLLGTRGAIVWLQHHEFGQPIRVDGPTSHLVKRGTPTMGGGVIIAASCIAYFTATWLTHGRPSASVWLLILLYLGCGIVGFLDDFIKVRLQDNRGLNGRAKLVGQTIIALVFGLIATRFFQDAAGVHPASSHLSTVRDWGPKLPLILVLLLIGFIVTGTSNATNLTDGADGLLTGISVLVFGAYTFVNVWQAKQWCESGSSTMIPASCYHVRDPLDLAAFSAAIAGACAGFLWWNAKPAKIIMGDFGSLALGGSLAGLAIMSRTELLMVLLGGVFVMETGSVMLQVSYFKWTRTTTGTGRRLFRIAPIHHHFEQLGWQEATLVIRFWLLAGVMVTAGISLFYAAWLV